jgi:dCTP deaminase
MTVLSAQTILRLGIVIPCHEAWKDEHGNSAGLSGCGYDITLEKEIALHPGCHLLCAAQQQFSLPNNVMGVVHDKSSLARRGLAVQNTVLEPGWRGFLTLEVTNHGHSYMRLAEGAAIAQVVFHFLDEPTLLPYAGKYQDQEPGPQKARSK